jgi:hypothetical protein
MPGRGSNSGSSATGAVLGAEPFDVVCACGQRHSGVRGNEYQVLECDACGRRLFVLPVCPYPELDDSAADRPDDVRPPRNRRRKSKPRDRDKERTRPRAAGTVRTAGTPSLNDPAPAAADKNLLPAKPRRKLITPLRLVAVGIVALLAATGVWKYQQSVRAQAERDFREHADRGDAALKDHDFAAAVEEYGAAVAALDKLGRDDEKSRRVRQMFRESRAASRLSPKTLPDIMADVRARSEADPRDWKHRFRSDYAGRWIVLDTQIRRMHSDEQGDFVRIDFLQAVGDRPVDLVVTGTAFDALNLDENPRRAILAVELSSCELGGANGDRWIVRFNPETAFLWSDYENFRALGFDVAAEPEADGAQDEGEIATERVLRDRLLSQSKLMGLPE